MIYKKTTVVLVIVLALLQVKEVEAVFMSAGYNVEDVVRYEIDAIRQYEKGLERKTEGELDWVMSNTEYQSIKDGEAYKLGEGEVGEYTYYYDTVRHEVIQRYVIGDKKGILIWKEGVLQSYVEY